MNTLVILNIYKDSVTQKITSVIIGFFDEKGRKQMEMALPSYLFPSDIKRNQQVYFSTLSPIL
jgi:hypothetical protein